MYGDSSRAYLAIALLDEIDWRDPRVQQKDVHKVICYFQI